MTFNSRYTLQHLPSAPVTVEYVVVDERLAEAASLDLSANVNELVLFRIDFTGL